ncbi:MAG: hypothetical protein HYR66_01250 [Sphingobacteriales bacterium]|nr:hypothetical protein [Sphingobacteriales bacterium]MBI3719342.1 hypothetical protein [Sphingobacteriales bacterium]
MEIRNSSDIIEDSGLSPLLFDMNIGRAFINKNYGNNEVKLSFVINCLDFNVKNRKRFDSKESVLYWDVILDYNEIKSTPTELKKAILANSIIDSFDILDKYKKLNLDKVAIKEDAKKYFKGMGWIE